MMTWLRNARWRSIGPALALGLGLGAFACGDDGIAANAVGTPRSQGFQITLSGEDLATDGYPFGSDAKANGDPPAFVDGWDVRFEHVIVTIANVRLNADPDKDEGNPENVGPIVATAPGPWAVDATVGGPIVGKSGSPSEKTVELTTISAQADGTSFDPQVRYAFSYDTVPASATAKDVNLDDAGKALYEEAKAKGWVLILAGTATYKGPPPAAGSVFAKIPPEVKFTLGMKNPSSYLNCQNTDLAQLPSTEFPRGVQPREDRVTVAQITIHTDHAFWSKLNVEGTELHFDPIAARASTHGVSGATTGTVTLDDLVDVDISGFQTSAGELLTARSAVSDFTPPSGQLAFDPNGTSFAKVNSFASYLTYSSAAGGHLNADGECTIRNNFTP